MDSLHYQAPRCVAGKGTAKPHCKATHPGTTLRKAWLRLFFAAAAMTLLTGCPKKPAITLISPDTVLITQNGIGHDATVILDGHSFTDSSLTKEPISEGLVVSRVI